MTNFSGEFDCKIDAKGRLMLPSGLVKQFPKELKGRFVANKSVFQPCLVIYPLPAWQEIVDDLAKLNKFRKDSDDFIRQYNHGALPLEMDNTNRLLFPKRLLDYASIEKDVVLTSSLNKIEMWSASKYNELMKSYNPADFARLAEKVMGGNSSNNGE